MSDSSSDQGFEYLQNYKGQADDITERTTCARTGAHFIFSRACVVLEKLRHQ